MLEKLISIITKRRSLHLGSILFISSAIQSCIVFNYNKTPEYAVDIVCGEKTDKSDAYEFSYKGNNYYFDSYNCKQIFKQNPAKFLENKCADTK